MLRSELAGQAACSPETLRYYEHIGLIEPPPRTAAGYRRYSGDHLRRVCFIRAARLPGTCDDDKVATCKIVEALCEEDFLAVSEEVHASPARRMPARKQPRNL